MEYAITKEAGVYFLCELDFCSKKVKVVSKEHWYNLLLLVITFDPVCSIDTL